MEAKCSRAIILKKNMRLNAKTLLNLLVIPIFLIFAFKETNT